MKVDFATFCYKGDAHRLHAPGQLKKQVESNRYRFNEVIVIHQLCNPKDYAPTESFLTPDPFFFSDYRYNLNVYQITNIDDILLTFDIDINKSQYIGDQAHQWKHHVSNHLKAISVSSANYIVFADNDCWMVRQPESKSWVEHGIELLQSNRDLFISISKVSRISSILVIWYTFKL